MRWSTRSTPVVPEVDGALTELRLLVNAARPAVAAFLALARERPTRAIVDSGPRGELREEVEDVLRPIEESLHRARGVVGSARGVDYVERVAAELRQLRIVVERREAARWHHSDSAYLRTAHSVVDWGWVLPADDLGDT